MRRWVGIFLAVTGCMTLTSCAAERSGVIGLMTDGRGKTSVVLQVCDGHLKTVAIFGPPEKPQGTAEPKLPRFGEWQLDSEMDEGFTQFDLATGGNGWQVVTPPKPRDPAQRYSLDGWSEDNTWSATGLTFRSSELAKLKPGDVLLPPTELEPHNRTQSLEDFRAKVCDEYGF